jgi:hypothetical protein
MLTPNDKGKFHFTDFITPRSPITFLGFAGINAMTGLLSSGNLIGMIFIPVFAAGWWLWEWRYRKNLEQEISYSLTKQAPLPSKGLILLLSPYDPRIQKTEQLEFDVAIQKFIGILNPTEADFASINLLNSNLAPQLAAVKYHAEARKLRDVWLVTTDNPGSVLAANILEQYVRYKDYWGQQFDIHPNHTPIKDYDYAGLWRLGESIFQDARQEKYQDEAVVADITGGTKLVSLAIAMACIPPGRRMQYMDAQRDWQGNPIPKGEMQPVDIDVDPIMLHHNARR